MAGPLIQVNGKSEPLAAATLEALLAEKEVDAGHRGTAVALNGAVVPRAAWAPAQPRLGFGTSICAAQYPAGRQPRTPHRP